MKDLKKKTVRGGVAKAGAQAVTFGLRLGAIAVLARILDPQDFGLVNMVTAFTGVFGLLKDAGLSLATVQRATVTEEQLSALFWVNVLVGAVLMLASLALAPALAAFYREPRLLGIAAALAAGFFLNGLGVQHGAILARQMRFTASAIIDVASIVVSTAIGIAMASAGAGYWALVGMSLAMPAVGSLGAWMTAKWVPGPPRTRAGIGSVLRLGGAVTLNGIIVYVAYNMEKVLLGRFWGADAVGIYGRAYQLINIPSDNLNSAVGGVAISALSRLQDDPPRFKAYFLKGYSLVLALTLPVTIACALFSEEIVYVILGPKWGEAAAIVRLLAPTILVFALINPTFWLLFALGLMERSVLIALVITPLVIAGYVIGLPHGPSGVALGYSAAMTAWLVPHLAWCVRGTTVRLADLVRAVKEPLLSGAAAATLTLGFLAFGRGLSPYAKLLVGGGLMIGSYATVLLYGLKQKDFYVTLVREIQKRPSLST